MTRAVLLDLGLVYIAKIKFDVSDGSLGSDPYALLRNAFEGRTRRSLEVEPIGLEPTTSCMPCKRSPN